MWKLLFFVVINGQPHLGLIDVDSQAACHQKAMQMLEVANKQEVPLAVRCVEIKVS